MESSIKTYDVAILTYNPDDKLISSFKLLLNQDILPSKIIILNTDESLLYKNIKDRNKLDYILSDEAKKKYKVDIEIIHIKKCDFDHGRTRNIAVKTSKSDYILFMTDDAVPCDDRLAHNLIDAFSMYGDETSRVAAAFARQIAGNDAKLKEKYIREYNYPDYDIIKDLSKEKTLGIKNYFLSNVCAMYDRGTLVQLGGFEEDIILNEDTFYAYRAIQNGYKIVYKADAKVFHSHDYTYRRQFSRNFDIGVSQRERHEIFDSVPSEKEGTKLLKVVLPRFLKEGKIIEAIDFLIECVYRYLGYKRGIGFESLSIDDCIKYASNKEYFIKKKKND